ncbi:MAG: rhomboid family intramembrane serine protease [Ferruginibacter sp.]
MTDTGIISLLLIAVNVLVSYKGFTNESFFDGYKFEVDRILINKDYKRLITSGFLHVSWLHLIFNMLSLYVFSGLIEMFFGGLNFLLIYFAGLIGGNLFSLFVHRNHGDYSCVGASGAVCAIIFASIALFPGIQIPFWVISVPGWLYGIVYVTYSLYGIKSNKDNIGHEAHLGGALIGMLTAIVIKPAALSENYLTILIITVPAIVFIYFIITKPTILLIDNFFFKTHNDHYSIDHKYNEQKINDQKEIDRILDKINRKGMSSLSRKEKQLLKDYSDTIR